MVHGKREEKEHASALGGEFSGKASVGVNEDKDGACKIDIT